MARRRRRHRRADVVGAVPLRRAGPAVLGGDVSLLASGRLDNQVSCWAATTSLAASPAADTVVDGRPQRPRGGRVGEHDRCQWAAPRTGPRAARRARGRRRGRPASAPCRRRRACPPTTPTPCTPTIRSATNPPTGHSSTPARRSSSTPTNGTRRRRTRPPCSSARATRLACRGRCSCRATTCRAARRSGRSPPPGSGIATVDVGVPQLSMHSARELCGVHDPAWLASALAAYFVEAVLRRVLIGVRPGAGPRRTDAATRREAGRVCSLSAARGRRSPAPIGPRDRSAGRSPRAPCAGTRSGRPSASPDRSRRCRPARSARPPWRRRRPPRRTAVARSARPCARPRDTARAPRPFEHFDAAPQRLAVGRAAGDREPAEGRQQPAERPVVPQGVLAHVPQPAAGDAARDRGVDVRAVDRREHERTRAGHVAPARRSTCGCRAA